MEDPVELGDWQNVFARHNVSDVRKIFRSLESRKLDHDTRVRELVGANHGQLVKLAAQIARAKVDALQNERELAQLSSSRHDAEWEVHIRNLDRYNSEFSESYAKATADQLAARLLGFTSDCWLSRRYSAAARSLYLASELTDNAQICSRVENQRAKLSRVVGDWLDNGINDGMSQELFNTCLIINETSSKKMVLDFFNRRKHHIEADLKQVSVEGLLQTMDLIGSTLFVANQLTDHVFKTKLSNARLLNSPELVEADLRTEELSRWLDKRIFDLPSFPGNCYHLDNDIDITAARADFISSVTDLLQASAGPIASSLDISDISSLYSNLILKIRDSAELSELGDVIGDLFHTVLVQQFEKRALEKFEIIERLDVELPITTVQSPVRLEFTRSTTLLLENLASLVSGKSSIAKDPLEFVANWATGCVQVAHEIKSLQHAASLHRDPNHRERLNNFTGEMSSRVEKAQKRSYAAGVSRLENLLPTATSPRDFVMLATLKQYMDSRSGDLGIIPDMALNATLDQRLAESLVAHWVIQGDKTLLEGLAMPSGVLNSLFELCTEMDSLLPNFQWQESTLSVLRPLVVAKVRGFDEAAGDTLAQLFEEGGELQRRFRCILGPLVPSESKQSV